MGQLANESVDDSSFSLLGVCWLIDGFVYCCWCSCESRLNEAFFAHFDKSVRVGIWFFFLLFFLLFETLDLKNQLLVLFWIRYANTFEGRYLFPKLLFLDLALLENSFHISILLDKLWENLVIFLIFFDSGQLFLDVLIHFLKYWFKL